MSKKPRFRTAFGNQHAKGYKTRPESPPQHFYHIFSSLQEILSWKISILKLREILRPLWTHLLPMKSILFKIIRIHRNQFKCNYLKNKKTFPRVFAAFLKFTFNFQVFLKKVTFTVHVFLKLQTAKDVVRQTFKKARFGTSLNSQHVEVNMS